MNIGIIILARINSERLHKKVLQKIAGKTAIEILIEKLQNPKYEIILAIPDTDIELEKIAFKHGIKCYRGQNDSPMHRFYECAKQNDFDNAVRITSDDIFIDTYLLYEQIEKHLNSNSDYTFMRQCPEGVAGEVIKISSLKKIIDKIGNKSIEFFHYYFRNKCFKTYEYIPPKSYRYNYRLTMDYEEDLFLIRILYLFLQEPFATLDIINFLKKNKFLLQLNRLPEITIFTCSYNTDKYIFETFDSIFSQTFKDFEYIIIDDNSTDESCNLILEYYSKIKNDQRKKIKLYRNKENLGLTHSSNLALCMARGKYIVRVDSDDVIKPDFLQEMLETIKLNSVQAVISGYDEIDEKGNFIKEVCDNMWHAGCSFFIKKIVNDMKYKNDIKYLEGTEFFNRFKNEFRYMYINKPLWKYRRRENQKSQESDHPNKILNKEVI